MTVSDWVCNSCSDRKPFPFILDVLKRSKFVPDVRPSLATFDQSVAELEGFIRKNKNILHPNHSLMTEVKLILYELYTVIGEEEPDVPSVNCKQPYYKLLDFQITNEFIYCIVEEMDKKEAILLDLLELVEVISPGKIPMINLY